MPRFNIFVRDEDLELWNAIEDRPRWVHNALVSRDSEILRTPGEAEKFLQVTAAFRPCKHGADPKLCKFAKNGKPCK